ncbi:MAG: hypothetical protein KDD82_14845, partial [Planctomycetes bacterium]|nr:hypothetical protein [Planctomycetota bacterium]
SAAYAGLVQASPEDPELRIALASARYRAGAVDEALPELKAAIDLLEATGDGAKALGARLEAWAQRGWVRYRLWGPSSAPRVFLPAPFDFARASPEENVNAQLARHSALQGDPLAQIKLASFMGEGHWLEQDLEGGGQILQRWSFAGHSEAQYRFFELLLRETPAWSGDAPAAEAWLRAAVAQGNENARDRQLRRAAKQR